MGSSLSGWRWVAFAAIVTMVMPATVLATQSTALDTVAIVVPASRTNGGWDQQGADNLTAVAQERGLTPQVAENAGYEDITPILQDLADGGADLIICHASGYQTVCPEFAAQSGVPVAVIENPGAVEPGLISDIETQAQEAAYLAGVVAGLETRSGTVGVVVSGEPPTWNFMTVGFAEGLKATRPEARLVYSVIGENAYDDAANAKRVTDSVLAAGADIVFGMGDGASFGMIQSIREFNGGRQPEQQAKFIDVIGDKRGTDAREILLTSVLFDYTGIYNQMLDDFGAGSFGQVYTMTLENNGVRLLDLPTGAGTATPANATPAATPASPVQQAVAEARSRIISGEITVPAVGDANGVRQSLAQLFPGE
ncbi:MAG: BMP family ABC transporter substrate-binding protein [Chloroflexia bacterium]|nr:BMP family ABC transporter substrate-binding protein [Chloroflexia bacterium]